LGGGGGERRARSSPSPFMILSHDKGNFKKFLILLKDLLKNTKLFLYSKKKNRKY